MSSLRPALHQLVALPAANSALSSLVILWRPESMSNSSCLMATSLGWQVTSRGKKSRVQGGSVLYLGSPSSERWRQANLKYMVSHRLHKVPPPK